MLEADLEQTFRQRVRKAGGLVVQLQPTTAGVPDRMVLHDGRVFLVELKTIDGGLSAIQRSWHYKAELRGVKVTVLHGQDEIIRWTEAL